MERLHFICPNTGQDIDVGAILKLCYGSEETEYSLAARSAASTMSGRCATPSSFPRRHKFSWLVMLQLGLPFHLFRVAKGS